MFCPIRSRGGQDEAGARHGHLGGRAVKHMTRLELLDVVDEQKERIHELSKRAWNALAALDRLSAEREGGAA